MSHLRGRAPYLITKLYKSPLPHAYTQLSPTTTRHSKMTKGKWCHNCFVQLDRDPGYKVYTDRLKWESDRVWQPSIGVMKALRAVRRYELAYYKQCQHPPDSDEESDNEEEEEMEEEHVCNEECWEEDCFGDFDFSMCIREADEYDHDVEDTAENDDHDDDSNSSNKNIRVQTADGSQNPGLEIDSKGDI